MFGLIREQVCALAGSPLKLVVHDFWTPLFFVLAPFGLSSAPLCAHTVQQRQCVEQRADWASVLLVYTMDPFQLMHVGSFCTTKRNVPQE